jgi:hypothetical protein
MRPLVNFQSTMLSCEILRQKEFKYCHNYRISTTESKRKLLKIVSSLD